MIFLNTQMDLFILKTDVEKFTPTNDKTLRLIFKIFFKNRAPGLQLLDLP